MTPSKRKHKERRPLPNPKLPGKLGKLLVYGVTDDNYLAFQLGKEGIYLARTTPIVTTDDPRLQPKIAVIRYENHEDVYSFLSKTDILSFRVFKVATFKTKARTRAFFYTIANNILGLAKGKVIRIKSKHPKLRKELYDIAVIVNTEGNFGCSFDYDEYDVVLELRKFKEEGRTWFVITTIGLDEIVSGTNSS